MQPIVRRRTSVVVAHQNNLLVFKAVDPHDNREMLFLPGGKIEENETEIEAAEREALEETNYRVKVDPTTRLERQYPFHWNGKDYHSVTYFYRAYLTDPFKPAGPVKDEDYNKGPLWIPVTQISAALSYSQPIREAVLSILKIEK